MFPVILFTCLAHHVSAQLTSSPSFKWIDTWTAMPQLTEFTNLPPPPFNQTNLVFPNSTIRQTLHVTLDAQIIRLRLSNAFGLNDLPITQVTVALAADNLSGNPEIVPETLKQVTFSGNQSIIIPNAALAVSDPVNLPVAKEAILTVTMYLADGQESNFITSHPGSRATSWLTFGNQVTATNITGPETQSIAHWFFVSAVEGWMPSSRSAFVVVGDSITDGRESDTDENDRWPDNLFRNMQNNSATANIAVVNQAAGGNRVLYDGLGPNALGRIDRDVLAQSGTKYAMIFEGVNDIGVADATVANQTLTFDRLKQAYKQIVQRVHTFGIPMFAATITPFGAPNDTIQPYSSPLREQFRLQINDFIRNSGTFDAVIDFDALVRDPNNHTQLNPIYNSGDYLHPNEAGYMHMAANFPLDIFTKFANGVSTFN